MNNEKFLAQLILRADPDIDDAGLEMLISDAEVVLHERLFSNIASKLNKEQIRELNAIVDGSWKDGEIYNFLSGKIDQYDKFIEDIYNKFEKIYLEEYFKN